jgi:hypothetical protein
MSISALPARPHTSDEAVKRAVPINRNRRRPRKSPSLPPGRRKAAYVSRNAFTIHSSLENSGISRSF